MANRFVLNETSYHGKGAILEIANEIKARAFKKILVCCDPDLIKLGISKKVTDILDNAEIAYDVFSRKLRLTVSSLLVAVLLWTQPKLLASSSKTLSLLM